MLEMPHVLDIEKSKIGWNPKYSSEEIIRETAGFMIKSSILINY